MFKRIISLLVFTAMLGLSGLTLTGCTKDKDIEVESHDDIHVQDTVDSHIKVE